MRLSRLAWPHIRHKKPFEQVHLTDVGETLSSVVGWSGKNFSELEEKCILDVGYM